MLNNVDPNQTAPIGAGWSRSTLFVGKASETFQQTRVNVLKLKISVDNSHRLFTWNLMSGAFESKNETIWQMQYKVEKIWSEYKQLIILQWEVTLIPMQNKLLPLQNIFILNHFSFLKLFFTTYTAEQLVGVCKIYTVQNYISQNGNL